MVIKRELFFLQEIKNRKMISSPPYIRTVKGRGEEGSIKNAFEENYVILED